MSRTRIRWPLAPEIPGSYEVQDSITTVAWWVVPWAAGNHPCLLAVPSQIGMIVTTNQPPGAERNGRMGDPFLVKDRSSTAFVSLAPTLVIRNSAFTCSGPVNIPVGEGRHAI